VTPPGRAAAAMPSELLPNRWLLREVAVLSALLLPAYPSTYVCPRPASVDRDRFHRESF
jgi:hypothetical protein